MFITDKKFFCEEINTDIPELRNIAFTYENKGLAAAEKQLADYVRQAATPGAYFRVPYYARENEWAYPYEDDKAVADRVIENKLMSCGYMHDFKDKVEWEHNPTYNNYVEWVFQLSRHHEWRCLGKVYRDMGDEKYAEKFVELFTGWCENEICPESVSGYATNCWRTIEAGIRTTKNWSYAFYSFYKSEHMTDHILTMFIKSIWEHGYRLSNFSTKANWLIMEMTGLFHLSLIHPWLKNAEEWKAQAIKRLNEEIDVQVYPDDFQYELSTGYHGVVIENYKYIFDVAKAFGYKLSGDFMNNVERMFNMYVKLAYPSGYTPNLNDGGVACVKKVLAEALKYFPENETFKYFATDGKEGKAPDFTSIALPYSGMATMRSGHSADAVWCFMESAPFGRAHQHEDKLNVLMFAYGKNVLSDPGNYAYDSSEMRKFIVDTRAHNCARVDGQSQNTRKNYDWKPEYIKKKSDIKWTFTENYDTVEGVFDAGYGESLIDVTHRRKLVFFKKGIDGSLPFAIVLDRLTSNDEKDHSFEVSYQMNTEKFTVSDNTYTADFNDGVTMSVISDIAPEVIIGQTEPYMMGFRPVHKAEEHEHAPAPCLKYTKTGKSARFATILYPSNNGEVPFEKAEVCSTEGVYSIVKKDGGMIVINATDYPCVDGAPEKYDMA